VSPVSWHFSLAANHVSFILHSPNWSVGVAWLIQLDTNVVYINMAHDGQPLPLL
jgi:hypothetical protein